MNQLGLFDEITANVPPSGSAASAPVVQSEAARLSRSEHPETSKQAAERLVDSGTRAKNTRRALWLVTTYGGMTGAELDRIDNARKREISKRLADLKNAGLVKHGVKRACTALEGNPQCVTWFATGRAAN